MDTVASTCPTPLLASTQTWFGNGAGNRCIPLQNPRLIRVAEPAGVDLTAIEGIDAIHALTLVSELGTVLSKSPTVKHFTSWLGWVTR